MGPFLVLVAIGVSAVIGWLLARRTADVALRRWEIEVASLRAQLTARDERLGQLRGAEERAAALAQALARAEAVAEQSRSTMRNEFEGLGRSMIATHSAELESLLEPMQQRLLEFEKKVQHAYDVENRDRGALIEKLRGLQEAQTRLHADAQALTRALTGDSRAQGDWGELVLESLLATAGLTEGREYELQVDHRDPDSGGHRRPDALIYLPPNRALVVDSKCSLAAFVQATRTPNEEEREVDLDAHVHSLRAHVKALSNKDYQRLLGERTLDLVLLFVPSEAAFHAAVSRDPSLYEDAFRQRVVLTSPTTLLATLQVVSHVWRTENQSLNARRIAHEAGKMIEKLALGLDAFSEVGEKLEKAAAAFEEARKRLVVGRGNTLQLARRVAQLGARPPHPERVTSVAQRLDADVDELDDALGELEQLELVPGGEPK
ncbi:MAG: DNA recombination protein RmuC [Archangium sp.]